MATSTKVKSRWNSAHYDKIIIYLSKEDSEKYKGICEKENIPFSQIPKTAIAEFIKAHLK